MDNTTNSFADRIIRFNRQLEFKDILPTGISIMNPFKNKIVDRLSSSFYKKYYSDNNERHLILGINPGRFGAGITGVPFTDPKRMIEKCKIDFDGELKHEPSSAFIYEMIDAYGTIEEFYNKFYINSVCPLGFTSLNDKGKDVNYNYYDNAALEKTMYHFIIENIKKQIAIGVNTDTAFCFGTGKNENFLRKLNDEKKFFKNIIALEHPRYIMQYKSKSKQFYINKYIAAFKQVINQSILIRG